MIKLSRDHLPHNLLTLYLFRQEKGAGPKRWVLREKITITDSSWRMRLKQNVYLSSMSADCWNTTESSSHPLYSTGSLQFPTTLTSSNFRNPHCPYIRSPQWKLTLLDLHLIRFLTGCRSKLLLSTGRGTLSFFSYLHLPLPNELHNWARGKPHFSVPHAYTLLTADQSARVLPLLVYFTIQKQTKTNKNKQCTLRQIEHMNVHTGALRILAQHTICLSLPLSQRTQ